MHRNPGWISRGLSWVGGNPSQKKRSQTAWLHVHSIFEMAKLWKWEQLSYCQGWSKWWNGREAGVILKEVQPMILAGLKLLLIPTSSTSLSWFGYWAIVFHDVTTGEIKWGFIGSPCIISWNCNLQFSQNWKYN